LARLRIPIALRGVGLFALCGALTPLPALAQAQRFAQADPASPFSYDPLAPQASDSGKQNKARPYQTFEQRPPARSETTTFEPVLPASGAGKTGFDSTNARTLRRTTNKNAARDQARTVAPGAAIAASTSPYQQAAPSKPAATAQSSYAMAGQPNQPPVEVGNVPPTRKKKKKIAEADPYDPLGWRSGGLVYYPAIELIGGYDSNPERTANGKGASSITVAPELRVRSDWGRHDFKADLRGSYNWYSPDATPSLDRPYFNGTTEGRIDVFDGTRIDLAGRVLVSTDNPNSPNLQAGLSKLPIFTSFGATAGVGQKFNRFDVSVKGTVDRTVYQDSDLTNGTTSSNEDRNFNQYGVLLRAGYELTPGVMPYVEVGADSRVHDLAVDFSGYRRDSTGWTALLGSTFELSRLLTGDIAAGYVQRDYDDSRLVPLKGFTGKGSLTWTATPLTTVKFTAASTVGESDQAGVSGVLYRDIGVEADHAFRRWLIGSLKGGVGIDDYVGSSRTDHRYYFGGGLTYKLNRFVQVKGEARHEWLNSSESVNDYAANVFLLGLRVQY
jgi:hypothetical protein